MEQRKKLEENRRHTDEKPHPHNFQEYGYFILHIQLNINLMIWNNQNIQNWLTLQRPLCKTSALYAETGWNTGLRTLRGGRQLSIWAPVGCVPEAPGHPCCPSLMNNLTSSPVLSSLHRSPKIRNCSSALRLDPFTFFWGRGCGNNPALHPIYVMLVWLSRWHLCLLIQYVLNSTVAMRFQIVGAAHLWQGKDHGWLETWQPAFGWRLWCIRSH